MSLYADNLTIYYRGKNLEIITNQLQTTAIHKIEERSNKTGFKISIYKTKAILFTKKRATHSPTITLYQHNIEFSDSILIPGYNNLKLKLKTAHRESQKIMRTKTQRYQIIKPSKMGSWPRITSQINTTIVRSKIDYASICFSTATSNTQYQIQTIQNSATKIATGAFPTSPNTLFNKEENP